MSRWITLCERGAVVDDHAQKPRAVAVGEASEVVVEDVDARRHAAAEAQEECVGGERLDGVDARLANDEAVDEQTQDVAHAVDHADAGLEPIEGGVQRAVDAEALDEGAEGDEPGDARERLLGGANRDVRRVGAAADERAMLAVRALASGQIATHPGGAPCGGGSFHSKSVNRLHGAPISQAFRARSAPTDGSFRPSPSPKPRLSRRCPRRVAWRPPTRIQPSKSRTNSEDEARG
jgi:hypothetical protein